jgi:thiol-disulfide isomerase/thioredoxin
MPFSPRSRKLLRWFAEAAFLVAVFLAVQAWQKRDVAFGPAPTFDARLTDGTETSLAAWRAAHPGRPVALHFWADWCPICKTVESGVDAVAKDWPVLTVAMQSGPAARVAGYLRDQGLNWPTVVDEQGAVATAYGLRGVPAFVVIDRDGAIRFVELGYTSELGMRLRLWWAGRS